MDRIQNWFIDVWNTRSLQLCILFGGVTCKKKIFT